MGRAIDFRGFKAAENKCMGFWIWRDVQNLLWHVDLTHDAEMQASFGHEAVYHSSVLISVTAVHPVV